MGRRIMVRVAIIGNSGSGKSTLAGWLSDAYGAPVLDLDGIAWEPGGTARPRDPAAAAADVQSLCSSSEQWIVEGCYASLVQVALAYEPQLLFLDPGFEQCQRNCKARPWEPHKYRSKAEQDEKLAFLLSWVADYYHRGGEMSLRAHQALFESYAGSKQHLRELPIRGLKIGELAI